MLNENEVVSAMCQYLKDNGYTIIKRCTTKQTGIDIIATNPSRTGRLLIEAKGATSSRNGSARYNKGFSNAQMPEKVGTAVYTALELYAENHKNGDTVAIAVADTQQYRSRLQPINEILAGLGIAVYLVRTDASVVKL